MSDGRLSKKELAVVTEIVGFLHENGFPPTVRELCGLLGYSSASTVHHYLKKLSENGVISYEPAKPRTLVFHGFID